jgi:hypothetical protein
MNQKKIENVPRWPENCPLFDDGEPRHLSNDGSLTVIIHEEEDHEESKTYHVCIIELSSFLKLTRM